MELDFNNLAALHWLWLVALLAIASAMAVAWRRRAMRSMIDAQLIARIAPAFSPLRHGIRAMLVIVAMMAVVLALTDPRMGTETEEVTRRGADVMFVVDVSRSMLAEDATPSRLDRAKLFIDDAVQTMAGDRIGLVDFAGVAAMRTPLTLNYGAFMTSVADLQPKSLLRGGSMLGDALRLAAQSFSSDAIAGRAIVLLSDGEDMGSDPISVAKEIFEKQGIRIMTIGLGDSRDGGRIPVADEGARTWLLHDGQEVWSKMDPQTLRDIAQSAGGLFVEAGTAHIDLGEILQRSFADLQRGEFETSTIQRGIPRYQWPVGLALLLLVSETLISDRKRVRRPTPAAIAGGSTLSQGIA
ncbi:MAG: VWA domain-containing protein [Phycisphaerales bacterium]|nr:VWA domain-containing protein [Phycisphaerales bacterium]